MQSEVTRRLTPEEEEVRRKREELANLRAALADGELELTDLQSKLAAFEGRYLREVGALYAELDEWNARIREIEAKRNPSPAADLRADEARKQADRAYREANDPRAAATDFACPPELKSLFREVAKRIHPDLARDAVDQARRTRSMAEANRAYQAGDADSLRRILIEYEDGADGVEGDGIGPELIRLIRQISLAKSRLLAIQNNIEALLKSEIALFNARAESARQDGRDLLAELAATVRQQIAVARKEYDGLTTHQAGEI